MQGTRRFGAVRLGAVLLALLAMATFARVFPAAAQDNSITIDLNELNDSGISGTATLTDNGDGTTTVLIDVTGATGGHPTHIHEGTCDDLNPNPLYPLNDVDADGFSETDVPVSLDELLSEPYAVNMHESATNLGTYVACGEIVAAEEATPEPTPTGVGGETTTTTPATGVGTLADTSGNAALLAGLAAIALVLVGGGLATRRRGSRA